MKIILSENEQTVKEWAFSEQKNGLKFNNDIVVTNKRFIHQQKLAAPESQKMVNRSEVAIENIKSVRTSYGAKRNFSWLTVGVVGIFLCLIALIQTISSASSPMGKDELPLFLLLLLIGAVISICGFLFHFKPEKCPIKNKKNSFNIVLESKTEIGSLYGFGDGNKISVKSKKPYNVFILILLLICGIIPGVAYYFIKTRKNNAVGVPEDIAFEIIDVLGSLILK